MWMNTAAQLQYRKSQLSKLFPTDTYRHKCKEYVQIDSLPITVKLTKVFLVGASVKSTLHLYCPASTPITSSILKVAGNVSGRKWARAPSHFSSDQMTDVDKASEDVNTSSPPTSILQKKEKRIHDNASNNYFCLVSGTPNTYVKANCFHFFCYIMSVGKERFFADSSLQSDGFS